MDTTQDANKVLRDAEASLRELIQRAASEQRYSDVVAIARLADGLARLAPEPDKAVPAPQSPVAAPVNQPRMRKSSTNVYPKFLREEDKLVKVGWSKKAREEYEHRVPFVIVTTFLNAIRAKFHDGELFTAIDVIPLRFGEEAVPDYQAYLALKWLHSEGIITKHPRDRYVVEPGRLGPNGVEEFWIRLPTTKTNRKRGSK